MLYNYISIVLAVIAIIINSIIFGYVASNSKNNNTNRAYLVLLTFTTLYILFDCIIIQAFSSIETKDIIVKIQAVFWMPLSILFLNFIYLFLKKQKDKIFYLFTTTAITSILVTLFSDKVLIGYKNFYLGTGGITGGWFLPVTFIGILPAAVYALYLIGKEGKIFYLGKTQIKGEREPFITLQLKILFFGSVTCLIVAVTTNILFDEVLGYSGRAHLASLSISIQSIFILPALVKYNFLNQPIGTLGDELYLNSSDAVFITDEFGIINNLNKAARKLFNLTGPIRNMNIQELFYPGYNFLLKKDNVEAKTKTDYYVTVAQNTITRGKLPLGIIVSIRDITPRKKAEEKLLETTNKLIEAQDMGHIGSFEYDVEKDTVHWSDKLYEIYGQSRKTFKPTNKKFFNNIVHPNQREEVIKEVQEALEKKIQRLDYFHKIVTPNGIEKWMHAIAQITYDKQSKPIRINGTAQDVTELYSTRMQLEESENRLKKAQEMAQLGNWEQNHVTGEIYWSPVLRKIFDIDLECTIKQKMFWSKVHPNDMEWMKNDWENAEKETKAYSGTFRIKLTDGEIKHLMEHAEFIVNTNGDLIKTVGTVIDMTELHQHQEELRKLSSHIQNVQEEERGRIAREVHDELGQRLTSITMDLAFLTSKVLEDTPKDIKDRLSALTTQADTTIKIIRKISQELRPSILDDLGLIPAIDWLKGQYDQRSNIHFTLDMPKEDINLNNEYSTAVFRIAQEALTNIMRHAEAKNVNIQIMFNNSEISLKVQDDGKGINEKQQDNANKSYGIFGMKERAAMLGGEMKIFSQQNKGTTIEVKLPLTSNQG